MCTHFYIYIKEFACPRILVEMGFDRINKISNLSPI